MKALNQHLKQALAALATADAGEMLNRRQMARVLRARGGPAVPPRRRVALWAGAGVSDATLDYALSTCKRLDAGLAVLHAEGADTTRLQGRLGEVAVHLVALRGRPEAAVRHFIATHSRVAFLVLDGDDPASQLLAQRAGGAGVPTVVVTRERAGPRPQSPRSGAALPALG